MTRQTLLLFATPEILLGELVCHDGSYSHLTLTDAGEQRLASRVSEWQEEGKDAEFQKRFQEWCTAQQITIIVLKSAVQVDYWHKLLQLPVTPTPRFTMLQDLAKTNADELIAWKDFLARADTIVANATKAAK